MRKTLLSLLVVFAFTLSACDTNTEDNDNTDNPGDNNSPITYTVILNITSELSKTITVDSGSDAVSLNSYAVNDGHIFEGWYTDSDLTTKYNDLTVDMDLELYAKWRIYDMSHLSDLPYYDYFKSSNPTVTITVTDFGTMTLELFPDVAKNTVDNFIKYIQDGDYSGSTFHRVIEDFMIQGGIVKNTNCPIQGEFYKNGIANPLSHKRGVISMARTYIMDSATSQFFIVHQDSTFLNRNYAGFGGLTSGFDVLDAIAVVDRNASDAPLTDVVIESITVELNGYTPSEPVCAN